jgi:hypothetical protein
MAPGERSVRAGVVAGALDVVAVVVFVAIGRASHDHGETATGLVDTAWPFLAGLAVGWTVTRAWNRPFALIPTGLGVWLSCVAAGMVLRVLAGQGTAVAFVAVALSFLGLELLGWRALFSFGTGVRQARREGRPSSRRRGNVHRVGRIRASGRTKPIIGSKSRRSGLSIGTRNAPLEQFLVTLFRFS